MGTPPGCRGAPPWYPRIALGVDAVVVHRHGDGTESLRRAISSWKERGYTVGRMFFADSDAGNAYWTGKWDGTPHPDDVERRELDVDWREEGETLLLKLPNEPLGTTLEIHW